MMTILIAVFSVCAFALIACFYMLYRNKWIHDNRVRLIYEDMEAYDKAPSYDEMFYKWWVWDFNKLVNDKKP